MVVGGTLTLNEFGARVVTFAAPPPCTATVPPGISTELDPGPTVSTLLVNETGGVTSTVLPCVMLRVPGASMVRVGAAETEKFGYVPVTETFEFRNVVKNQ